MLEKINDINFDARFKDSNNTYYKNKRPNGGFVAPSKDQDSISFSPAFQYVSKLKFKIKDVKQDSDDKLLLILEWEDLVFSVNLDTNDLVNKRQLVFKSRKIYTGQERLKSIMAWFKINIGKITDEDLSDIHFEALNIFFDQIDSSGMRYNLNMYNSTTLASLIEGLEDNLTEEFMQLSFVVINFVDKLLNTNLLEKLGKLEENEEIISLQMIKQAYNDSKG